eukprot:3523917-Pleurochrysis_carterae.AAC.1
MRETQLHPAASSTVDPPTPAATPENNAPAHEPRRATFQRGLGWYPLRSAQPSALLVTRRHRCYDVISDGVRGHGCALAASS